MPRFPKSGSVLSDPSIPSTTPSLRPRAHSRPTRRVTTRSRVVSPIAAEGALRLRAGGPGPSNCPSSFQPLRGNRYFVRLGQTEPLPSRQRVGSSSLPWRAINPRKTHGFGLRAVAPGRRLTLILRLAGVCGGVSKGWQARSGAFWRPQGLCCVAVAECLRDHIIPILTGTIIESAAINSK